MGKDLLNLPRQGRDHLLLIEFSASESKLVLVHDSDLLSSKLEKTHLDLLRNASILANLLKKYDCKDELHDWKLIPLLKIRKNLLDACFIVHKVD